jgi:hypothetical protein
MLMNPASDEISPKYNSVVSLCVTQVYGNRKRYACTRVTKGLLILLGIGIVTFTCESSVPP